jgi:hypothetical protein
METEIKEFMKNIALTQLNKKPEEFSIKDLNLKLIRREIDDEFPPLTTLPQSMAAITSLTPLGDCAYNVYRSTTKIREVTEKTPIRENFFYLYPDDPLRIKQVSGEKQPFVILGGYEMFFPHALVDCDLKF